MEGILQDGGDNERSNWIFDLDLRREMEKASPTDYSGQVRNAFILLERRIRQTAGLPDHEYGTGLVDLAFAPKTGALQPVSRVEAECAGLHYLLKGIFLYYRNPVAHRPIDYTEESAKRVLALIDHSLHLVNEAAYTTFNLEDFVSSHEGVILHRHDFRLDIDSDGQNEIVILIGFGPVTEGGALTNHLSAIVLKKKDDSFYRIPADSISGKSFDKIGWAEIRNITTQDKKDILIYWSWDSRVGLLVVLREKGGKYVIAQREIPDGAVEPYKDPVTNGFFIHLFDQRVTLADVDGDGLVEITQILRFRIEDLPTLGYSELDVPEGEAIDVCRVYKWNDQKELIEQIDERVAIGLWRPEEVED